MAISKDPKQLSWPTIKWITSVRWSFFLLWKSCWFCSKIHICSSPGLYMPQDRMSRQKKQWQLSKPTYRIHCFTQRWKKEAGGFWFWWGGRYKQHMLAKSNDRLYGANVELNCLSVLPQKHIRHPSMDIYPKGKKRTEATAEYHTDCACFGGLLLVTVSWFVSLKHKHRDEICVSPRYLDEN